MYFPYNLPQKGRTSLEVTQNVPKDIAVHSKETLNPIESYVFISQIVPRKSIRSGKLSQSKRVSSSGQRSSSVVVWFNLTVHIC